MEVFSRKLSSWLCRKGSLGFELEKATMIWSERVVPILNGLLYAFEIYNFES